MDKLRLRNSIGIVTSEKYVDFFKSNTRESILLKMNSPDIISILQEFDGEKSIDIICDKYNLDRTQLLNLATYLYNNHILINHDKAYPGEFFEKNYRVINLLEDFCFSTSEVMQKLSNLKQKKVMIIGLGAVGSIVAVQLTNLGVGNLILVDNDLVDESNLHRQYYFEEDIGSLKSDSLKNELVSINHNVNVSVINDFLTEDFFIKNNIPENIDLIINCSDEPSVDVTSRIVSEYAMLHRIPHIIGGGYNLHLTLIGQTIIPYKTACFECFNLFLNELNDESLNKVKKLHREDRRLGSFSPLSGIASNLAVMDAFKILIEKYDYLQQINKRIEFNTKTYELNVMNVEKNSNCKWCGNEK